METNISYLVGKTLSRIESAEDEILFHLSDGRVFALYHDQDCCEYVRVESVVGDFDDLIGTPILVAEERVSEDGLGCNSESYTWTFYCLRTIKGSVDIRWLGESNGYYSESVNFGERNP